MDQEGQTQQTPDVQNKAVAWLGITGSSLLILSATIFVWSNWNSFPNAVKIGIIAAVAIGCFLISRLLAKPLPVMSSVFQHLSIFLVPLVLLSFNMEGFFQWRYFLIFEGFFCVAFFYLMSRVTGSKVLQIASVLSTAMIALGLSSLEDTTLGSVPAAVYIIPMIIGLTFIPKLKNATLILIIAVGLSPIMVIFAPSMTAGEGVVEGFGLAGDLRWYYPFITALGLLVAIIFTARVNRNSAILNLIPLAIVPSLILTIGDESLTAGDLIIIFPLLLLVLQIILLMLKADEVLIDYYNKVNEKFSIFLMTIETYIVLFIAAAYAIFLIDHSDDASAFFDKKQGIAILLVLSTSIISYINSRSLYREMTISLLGMFGVSALLDYTTIVENTHRETRMIICASVVGLLALAFKKNYLACVLAPLGLVAIYTAGSTHTYFGERIAAQVIFITAVLLGLFLNKNKNQTLLWLTSSTLGVWLLVFAINSIPELLPRDTTNLYVYKIGFVFIFGLVLTHLFDLLTIGKEYVLTMNSEAQYLRPARVLLATAFISTWYLSTGPNRSANITLAVIAILVAWAGSWLRRESLPLCLVAPTFVAGVYSLGYQLNIDNSYFPLVFTGLAGIWLLVANFRSYLTIGCLVNGAYCLLVATFDAAFTEGTDGVLKIGQVIAMAGLILMILGFTRKVGELVPTGSTTLVIGIWIMISTYESITVDMLAGPAAFGLVIFGMYARNLFVFDDEEKARSTRPSSWVAYSAPILIYGVAAFYESINTGERIHSLIAGIACVIAITVGAWRKLIAPLFLGTVFLILFIAREVLYVASGIPIWAWIGIGALVLIAVAVLLERSQSKSAAGRKKISAVVSDTFE